MSSITGCKGFGRFITGLTLTALVAIGAGCSSANRESSLDPETGMHAANWIIDHPVEFLQNQGVCKTCHGTGLKGGISKVSCFSASVEGAGCHANGPGHPSGWSNPEQHGVTAEKDFSACKTCHGAAYQGGLATTTCYQCHDGPGLDHPGAGWVVAGHKTAALADMVGCQKCHGADYLGGGSHVACTGCHMEDRTKVHRLGWYPDVQLNHRAYAATNGTSSCANLYCHGANLSGVANSGPSCSTCHAWPFAGGGACGTCHGIPPEGSSFPDRAGRHSAHAALGSFVTCGTCHTGAGPGTANHQNGTADVNIAAAYNAKTGASTYNPSAVTCSNVSCHGAQTTPGFLNGTINSDTQCTACHAYDTRQFNGFSSGRHDKHVNDEGFGCTECHDTSKLAAVHFNDLNTSAMNEAWKTLIDGVQYTGTGTGSGNCTISCHGKNHSPETWR